MKFSHIVLSLFVAISALQVIAQELPNPESSEENVEKCGCGGQTAEPTAPQPQQPSPEPEPEN